MRAVFVALYAIIVHRFIHGQWGIVNPSNSKERWCRVRAVWSSPKTTVGFVLAFAAWLVLLTVTSMRRADDPKSTTGITLRLLHDVHARSTFRGTGLFRSVAQLGDPDDLVGSGRPVDRVLKIWVLIVRGNENLCLIKT